MTKLKIDFNSGLIEVEGDDQFVKTVYEEYKAKIFEKVSTIGSSDVKLVSDISSKKEKISKTKIGKNGTKRKESYSIIKDLDLSSKNGKESLKEFFTKKHPSSAMQNNVVFVYYLEKIKGVSSISPNHIYTCYKDVGVKIPGALRQSLIDTAGNKGAIDTKSLDNIKITTIGENLVELDLPRIETK